MARNPRAWRVVHHYILAIEEVVEEAVEAGRVSREAARPILHEVERALDISSVVCERLDQSERLRDWSPRAA